MFHTLENSMYSAISHMGQLNGFSSLCMCMVHMCIHVLICEYRHAHATVHVWKLKTNLRGLSSPSSISFETGVSLSLSPSGVLLVIVHARLAVP